MREPKRLLVSLAVCAAIVAVAGLTWSYDTGRLARRVKTWTSGMGSDCFANGDDGWARGMVQAWMDEVDTHPGWSERSYYNYTSYGTHFCDNDDGDIPVYGKDHTSNGMDNADAVMAGLHGGIEEHNDNKETFRARTRYKFADEPSELCKAWLDYYDYGDDNGDEDLEWMHMVSCHSADSALIAGEPKNYNRWKDAFDGLNSATGYAGEVWVYTDLGEDLAEDFFDNIADSWLLNNYTTSTSSCTKVADCTEGSGQKRCPVWVTYHETTQLAADMMNYDDYTTRQSEPPGHGGNNYCLRARYSGCDACCEWL